MTKKNVKNLLRWLDHGRTLIGRIVHLSADRPDLSIFIWARLHERDNLPWALHFGIQPQIARLRWYDGRNSSVMQFAHLTVGPCGQNSAGLDHFSSHKLFRRFPRKAVTDVSSSRTRTNQGWSPAYFASTRKKPLGWLEYGSSDPRGLAHGKESEKHYKSSQIISFMQSFPLKVRGNRIIIPTNQTVATLFLGFIKSSLGSLHHILKACICIDKLTNANTDSNMSHGYPQHDIQLL